MENLFALIVSNKLDDFETYLSTATGYEINGCNGPMGCSPLHMAVFMKNFSMVQNLLLTGLISDIDCKDEKFLTPLHRACRTGSLDVVQLLLKYKANPVIKDKNWLSSLHVAAAHSVDCLNHILEKVDNVNLFDRFGRTPLHLAVGSYEAVDLLLQKGADLNAVDKRNRTPLHLVATSDKEKILRLLISQGARLDVVDKDGLTPLHLAVSRGQSTNVTILIEAGAKLDCVTNLGNTVLHIACLCAHEPTLDVLLKSTDSDLDEFTNNAKFTPLHYAARHSFDCTERLLRYFRQQQNGVIDDEIINAESADLLTPLHMSAILGDVNCVKVLLDNHADVEAVDRNGRTALHLAAMKGHKCAIEILLQSGAFAEQPDMMGQTALHHSAGSGFVTSCKRLIVSAENQAEKLKSLLNAQDIHGFTALHIAVLNGRLECVEYLLNCGANPNIVDNLGRLPIHYAAQMSSYHSIFKLITARSDVNLKDKLGRTPLHLCVRNDMEGICTEFLITNNVDIRLKDNQGYNCLNFAASAGNSYFFGLLSQLNLLDAFVEDESSLFSVHLAANYGHKETLEVLFSNKLNFKPNMVAKSLNGMTPLCLAAANGHAHVIGFLLQSGADITVTDSTHGCNAVHYAAFHGHDGCLDLLLLHNMENCLVLNARDNRGRTPFMLAAVQNQIKCLKSLFLHGADPDAVDYTNNSALLIAATVGALDAVKILMDKGADYTKCNTRGKSVLHMAAMCGQLETLTSLLELMRADLVLRNRLLLSVDNFGLTPLHYAAQRGYEDCVEVIQFICQAEYDDIFFKNGRLSPLHFAALNSHVSCVKLLLLYDQSNKRRVNCYDHLLRNPLHMAASVDSVDSARMLIEKGADVNARDKFSRTALIVSALNGALKTAELLLENGADVDVTEDIDGNTALHCACLKDHSEIALVILKQQTNNITSFINSTNKNGQTALHLSASHGLVDVCESLLVLGASVCVSDNRGYSPAMACAPNDDVAACLGMILAIWYSSPSFLDEAKRSGGKYSWLSSRCSNSSSFDAADTSHVISDVQSRSSSGINGHVTTLDDRSSRNLNGYPA